MAYNNYNPNYFYPNYPAYQLPQIPTPPQSQPTPTPQTPQIQNGGFISVRSETEARNYPVAPGNSVTFFDETVRYCYTKTSLSQLEAPRFEKYKLVKEEETPVNGSASPQKGTETPNMAYATKDQMAAVVRQMEALKAELEILKKEGIRYDESDADNEPDAAV
jgi:hypothetical protein